MRIGRKLLGLFLAVVMFVSVFAVLKPNVSTSAAKNQRTPKITVKKANSGTGVKITISKTKGAEGYGIYITNTDNAYSKYMYNDGKYDRWVGNLAKDGTKKRTFTIKGLPKGKYTFMVEAYGGEGNRSAEKTIKIKAAKTKEAKEKIYDFSKAGVGDVIEFGSYEQDDNMKNGKEAIEWIILSKDKNQMLVVSKYALDTLPYNKEIVNDTWESSTIREWLNKSFYNTAFTDNERKMIKSTKLTNVGNSEYGIPDGNDTTDNIFLLSLDDVTNTEYGFNVDLHYSDIARRCEPTAYAVAQGAYVYEYIDEQGTYVFVSALGDNTNYMTKDGARSIYWWLRSPGCFGMACFVSFRGIIDYMGFDYEIEECGNFCVRPALYINLNS